MGAEAPEPDTANPGLATVIGKNARRLRTNAGLTLDQVSIAAHRRGLKWSESRVADFEAGRVAPHLGTLAAFCLALTDAGCANATFPRLLKSLPPIQINESLLLWDDDLVNLLSDRPVVNAPFAEQPQENSQDSLTPYEWVILSRYPVDDLPTLGAVMKSSGATEQRMRKSLGISSALLANLSAAIWKRTFSQERDRRAGEGANAQKRGQFTRQMRAELQAAIEAATHGDDK